MNNNTNNNNTNVTTNNTNTTNTQKKKGGVMIAIMWVLIVLGGLTASLAGQDAGMRCVGCFMMSIGLFYEASHMTFPDKSVKEQTDIIKGITYAAIGTGVLGLFLGLMLFATNF